MSFTCSTASALHPSICDHCCFAKQTRAHGASFFYPFGFGEDLLGSVSQRRRFANAARLQKLYSLHKRRTLKATNPHCLSLGGVVATAPALRKHNQDQSSKETVKTISLELDRVEHGNMEYEHGAVSCFAWCSRMSKVHPELPKSRNFGVAARCCKYA